MKRIDTLSHSKWVCKYHGVFIPKYRHKALYKELRRHLGDVFRSLADQYECRIEEGHLMPDHVHILLSIPPKCVVSDVVDFPKGKSAIHIARTYVGRRRNFTGQHFWARGYDVSTVGRAEATIRAYIQRQEKECLQPRNPHRTEVAVRSVACCRAITQLAKADVSWEVTGKCPRRSAGVGDQASGKRVAEITPGRAILQQGLTTTCKAPVD